MKCRVCRGPAVIDIARHNANFCVDHFLRYCRQQVERSDQRFRHARGGPTGCTRSPFPGARTALPCGTSFSSWATRPTVSTSGWASASYSDIVGSPTFGRSPRSGEPEARRGRSPRSAYDYDIPTAAAVTRRVPCSGLRSVETPRVRRSATIDGGYDALVTGHNLDDEVCRSVRERDAVADRLPRSPTAGPASRKRGFPRKVKPLVRLTERRDRGLLHHAWNRLPGGRVPDGRRQQAPSTTRKR